MKMKFDANLNFYYEVFSLILVIIVLRAKGVGKGLWIVINIRGKGDLGIDLTVI